MQLWKVQRTPKEQAFMVNLSGIRQSAGFLKICAFFIARYFLYFYKKNLYIK